MTRKKKPVKLHIRRRDDGRLKKPGELYFITLSILNRNQTLFYINGAAYIESLDELLLLTRAAHPQEYADALDRFLRRHDPIEVEIVNARGEMEHETFTVMRYLDRLDGGEISAAFIEALLKGE